MRFENRLPPEGINVSKTHPIVEFASLSAGVFSALAALAFGLYLAASFGAQWLPFSFEKSVADIWLEDSLSATSEATDARSPQHTAIEAELQSLASALAARMDLPAGVSATTHYVDDDAVNALATLGGHIFVFRGLLERLPHENALSLVLAHEIAHVAHRDPIRHMGGRLVVGLVIDGLIGGQTGLTSAVIGGPGDLVALSYSRDAERAADAAALRALQRHYGHIGGAADLFDVFADVADPTERRALGFLRTHPLREDRVEAIHRMAGEEAWATTGSLSPLSKVLAGAVRNGDPNPAGVRGIETEHLTPAP